MVIIQGVTGSKKLDAVFGQDDNHSWEFFRGEGWEVRIILDKSHHVRRIKDGLLIHDRMPDSTGETLESLNGAFLRLNDHPAGGLEIITDRIASIPLYMATASGYTCFSSRLIDLGQAGWQSPDPLGIYQWALLGQPIGASTPLKDVSCLPNASVIQLLPSGVARQDRYWIPRANPEVHAQTNEHLEEALDQLRAAHQRCAPKGDQGLALPVTGGFDSRCNLALWEPQLKNSLLFHVEDLGNFELPIARQIAGRYNLPLLELSSREWMSRATQLDLSIETGEFNAAHWRLSEPVRILAREHSATATIDGFFQDMLLKASFLTDQPPETQLAAQHNTARYGAKVLGLKTNDRRYRDLEASIEDELLVHKDGLSASQDYYIRNRSRRLVYNIVRLNQNFLDVKTPGMDHRLIDYGTALPWNLRHNALLYRSIINRLDPALARIRYDKSGLPLIDPRKRSTWRRVQHRLVTNLNHLLPNRSFFLDVETNFGRLFRESPTFRHMVARHVEHSEWVTALFGPAIIQRLEKQRRAGRPVENVIGVLVTLASLDYQCHNPEHG